MPAKSWTGKPFPVDGAHLVVKFANSALEMADEFTRYTFPFRFTIPPASLDPSVPRPGPYIFHGGGLQNPQYPVLNTNVLQFIPAASLRSTSSSPASSTSTGEKRPSEGPVNRNRCSNWSEAETRFFWKYRGRNYSENQCKRSHSKLCAFESWIFWVNGLNFTVKTGVKLN